MSASPLAADLRRVIVLLIIGGALGWLFEAVLVGLALALAVALGWNLLDLAAMQRWLGGRGARPARRVGVLAHLEDRIDRSQRQARKRKKRLRKVMERFQQASEANPDGALIIDGQDRIEWLNRAAARMLGLRQGQDHGQLISNLLRAPEFADWLEHRDETDGYELDSPVNPDQRLLLRLVPYGGSRSMMMVRDITRLHTLEQMRRDFVANVSHELRSPLTVLMGYLEGMDDDEEMPERFRRPVTRMAEQSARMTRIVEDLLRLSRIESDPDGASRVALVMSDLIESILRDADRVGGAGHTIEVEARSDAQLLGEYNEIYSALSNLVFNAMQYTPSGGEIRISWETDDSGTGVFTVRDTGVGIEAHHIPRLTERFYRADKARSRELGGTGLGLAIVKHVLVRHGAILEVSSEPGEGSEFSCWFPPDRVQQPAVATEAKATAELSDASALDG